MLIRQTATGDGISGRPNYVWDAFNGRVAVGRFGWKANQPHLLQQVASAFNGDIGITSSLRSVASCTAAQPECLHAPSGGEPEISDEDLLKVVLYSSALAVPARRNWAEPHVLRGQQLFTELGCVSCHVAQLQTGVHPTIPALSHQTIFPYTDLLLHDMGPELADGRSDFAATGASGVPHRCGALGCLVRSIGTQRTCTMGVPAICLRRCCGMAAKQRRASSACLS